MRFVFFKFILFFFSLFVFSVEADQVKPQEKEAQAQPQVKTEKQSSPQEEAQKQEASVPSKKEEQLSSQLKADQPPPRKEAQKQESPVPLKKEVSSQNQVPLKKEEPQQASGQLQILEIKKETATIKVPANQKLSVDQILYVNPMIYPGDTPPPPKKAESAAAVKRNGFVSFALNPNFVFYEDFKYDDFYLDFSTSYGIVFGKSSVADTGIIEGAMGLSGTFGPKKWIVTLGFDVEINFIKNDGVNKIIPGLRLGSSLSYKDNFGFLVNGGGYFKYFALKQLAIIPSLHIGYEYFQKGAIGLGVGLQARMYF